MKVVKPIAALGVGTVIVLSAGTAYAASPAEPFGSAGAGTEASLSAAGCQFTTAGCTVRSDGTAVSTHIGVGPYTFTLTVYWGSATSNGTGGYCAPASGSGTITAANGDQLNQTESGTVCEVGATGANVPHTFTGTFANAGGTGRFASATGGGQVNGGDDGYGNSTYKESGTISY